MRVVHLCQRDNPKDGGAYRVAWEFLRHQRELGIDAHVVFLYGDRGPVAAEFPDCTHFLGIDSPRQLSRLPRLNKELARLQPDIVHDHQPVLWSTVLTFFHRRWKRVTHGHMQAGVRSFGAKTHLLLYLQRLTTDHLVCISPSIRESWIREGGYHPSRTTAVLNGIPSELYRRQEGNLAGKDFRHQYSIPEDVCLLGSVGRLQNRFKGTDDLLRALRELPNNWHGLIVGTGPDLDQLKSLAAEMGIQDRTFFVGLIEDPIPAYHAMDVFALTSHFEPFGLVVGEAMAAGLPVVRFACPGGVNDVHTHEVGWIVPERNAHLFATAVMEAHTDWQNPERSARKREAIQELLETKLNWRTNTQQLVEIYSSLLQK
ncbi:MAG: glycosyltransferase [Candidatus Sumerlaeia bacterium]|nr:glycosyltransferase [Candidatus Sumerlaeia bacterium]